MIIYEGIKTDFINDIENGVLVDKLYSEFMSKVGRTSLSERQSWQNSMQFMYMVMMDQDIPTDAGVAIEYKLPTSSKRIDFIITGQQDETQDAAVIIELKQWSKVEAVDTMDGIVRTLLGGQIVPTTHPSYQAYSYASVINDYNEIVQQEGIKLYPCAYLHNYPNIDNDPLFAPQYQQYIEKAPAFTASGTKDLRNFIKKYITKGDQKSVLYKIENGKIRPSKSLQDALASMLKGNQEFMMIDEQKIVYETAKDYALACQNDLKKRVMIVKGGPGTGKTVVAIQLLTELTKHGLVTHYLSKNSAPRNVYKMKLKGHKQPLSVDFLFKGSGVHIDSKLNEMDGIIVDEAHRLNEKSGMFQNLGENQMKEIIQAGLFSIFFIDESQRIHIKDAGKVETIKGFANLYNAEVIELELSSQFRCNGSDGYLAWLDDVLGIRTTANGEGFDMDYDIQIIDSPHELKQKIVEKNQINNKARIVAGYCWEWPKIGQNDPNYYDIHIPEFDFHASWNLGQSQTYAIDPESVNEIGCIHTTQGLEFDYIGVIIGRDLIYRNHQVVTDYTKRAKSDQSIKGLKTLMKNDPIKAQLLADEIIKNTYRTLMTRGQKGCYIYCEDIPLGAYLKRTLDRLQKNGQGGYKEQNGEKRRVAEDLGSY